MLMLQLCYCTVLLIGTYPHRIVVVNPIGISEISFFYASCVWIAETLFCHTVTESISGVTINKQLSLSVIFLSKAIFSTIALVFFMIYIFNKY